MNPPGGLRRELGLLDATVINASTIAARIALEWQGPAWVRPARRPAGD
jgi:hypothetical protein